jgi:hypothetical protein
MRAPRDDPQARATLLDSADAEEVAGRVGPSSLWLDRLEPGHNCRVGDQFVASALNRPCFTFYER